MEINLIRVNPHSDSMTLGKYFDGTIEVVKKMGKFQRQ